ncbi:hypothetical protein ACNKHV_12075 [Shigella flexneri]
MLNPENFSQGHSMWNDDIQRSTAVMGSRAAHGLRRGVTSI